MASVGSCASGLVGISVGTGISEGDGIAELINPDEPMATDDPYGTASKGGTSNVGPDATVGRPPVLAVLAVTVAVGTEGTSCVLSRGVAVGLDGISVGTGNIEGDTGAELIRDDEAKATADTGTGTLPSVGGEVGDGL